MKVHADSYHGFASPNLPPLATAGVTIDFASTVIREPSAGPIRRWWHELRRGGDAAPSGVRRVRPRAALARPGLRGLVLEAYGAGNGPTEPWFLDPLRAAADSGVVVVVTTQCRAEAWSAVATPPVRRCSAPARCLGAT